MSQTPDTPSIHDRIAEIEREAKQNKVELTTEVQEYIRTHLEAVQRKLASQEDVTEADLQFIQDVRLWVSLPEEWRKKYRSIDEMNKSDKVQGVIIESTKRRISPKQWLDLLHVAYATRRDEKWIGETFRFLGDGKIETYGNLKLNDYTLLITLPAGLTVNGVLNLSWCKSLTSLPTGLIVGLNLDLSGCTSLTSLPADMEVGGDLYLPDDLHEQVKKDAERLKKEGKIKGEIKYN